MSRILIIDDNTDICFMLSSYLKREKFEADEAYTGKNGLKLIEKQDYGVVFCDYRLPDFEGIDLLREIKKRQPAAQVIMMTAYADVKIAIRCMKMGALDYITKPIHHEEVLHLVRRAPEEKSAEPTKKAKKSSESKYVWGTSPQSQRLLKNLQLVAPTDMTVIIQGESGTGKEYVANSIHEQSARKGKPFVAIDCGSLTEELAGSELFGHIKGAFTGALQNKTGQFELANGGTLFMDEIGNLSYENQVKLLRVLQERKVRKVGADKDTDIDVRLIVATNENLQQAVADGRFREDIFHRLNEFMIEVEPLRNRKEDIGIYINHFLQEANSELGKNVSGIDEITLAKLENYFWHGNLRELRNVIKRAVLLTSGDQVSIECIPTEIVFGQGQGEMNGRGKQRRIEDLKSVVEEAEKEAIIQVLKETNFNKSQTAQRLKVDRKTLYNKMNQYDLM
jgi:two-component system response regulator HydG